jgi:hypothetical protein
MDPSHASESGIAGREPAGEDTKRCSRCGKTAVLERFPPNPRMRDGRSSWCRRCQNAVTRDGASGTTIDSPPTNAERRVDHSPRPCSECGEQFTPGRPDALVCSRLCRCRRSRRLQSRRRRRRWFKTERVRNLRVADQVFRKAQGRRRENEGGVCVRPRPTPFLCRLRPGLAQRRSR